jgi:cellulose biosynthesis protein BcsQ
MKSISVFNNKGGVGKTTLAFHLAHALAEMGHRTLVIDLDPQCNITMYGMAEDELEKIWREEEPYIDDFSNARQKDAVADKQFDAICRETRSIHFLLKPTEDGVDDVPNLPEPFHIGERCDLIPGRLSMHMYEDKIASRWSDVYQGDPLGIRTITKLRGVAEDYAKQYEYQFVIMDTSPSLGALNKVIISTTDGFLIPCVPDMFSLYGIKNIGHALTTWKNQFDTIFRLCSDEKRRRFPEHFVRFLGFTIFNAKKYSGQNALDLAQSHYHYASEIPDTVERYIAEDVRSHLPDDLLRNPIGGMAVMHSHVTMATMAQKYRLPIWKVPECSDLDTKERSSVMGNRAGYEATREKYYEFATDILRRSALLE